jgi:hypothetical protein
MHPPAQPHPCSSIGAQSFRPSLCRIPHSLRAHQRFQVKTRGVPGLVFETWQSKHRRNSSKPAYLVK